MGRVLADEMIVTLNLGLGAYLGLRVLYTILYIRITDNKASRLRSQVWIVQTLILFGLYIMAGNKMAAKP